MRRSVLPIALLLTGCATFLTYTPDTELEVVMVDGKRDENARFVLMHKEEPIPPTRFGQRLIPSGWACTLASRWADLPFAFEPGGPEYCTALGVDQDRMLHASPVVRYLDPVQASQGCPDLVWTGEKFMIALGEGHSHSSPDSHGERMSAQDASRGSPMLPTQPGRPELK